MKATMQKAGKQKLRRVLCLVLALLFLLTLAPAGLVGYATSDDSQSVADGSAVSSQAEEDAADDVEDAVSSEADEADEAEVPPDTESEIPPVPDEPPQSAAVPEESDSAQEGTDSPDDTPEAPAAIAIAGFSPLQQAEFTCVRGEELPQFPASLQAQDETGALHQLDVSWSSETYTGAEGDYVFLPVLPEGYTLAPQVALPAITLTVQAAPAAAAEAEEPPAEAEAVTLPIAYYKEIDNISSFELFISDTNSGGMTAFSMSSGKISDLINDLAGRAAGNPARTHVMLRFYVDTSTASQEPVSVPLYSVDDAKSAPIRLSNTGTKYLVTGKLKPELVAGDNDIFSIESDVDVEFRDLTINAGRSNTAHSIVYMKPGSTLTLDANTILTNNTKTSGDGGAICNRGGTVKLGANVNSSNMVEISKCSATNGSGGAIYSYQDGVVNLNAGTSATQAITISECKAQNGGAIAVCGGVGGTGPTLAADQDQPMLTIATGTRIWLCEATNDGGAVYLDSADFLMTGGTLEINTAGGNGGAVYYYDKGVIKTGRQMNITGGAFEQNAAGGNGGAICFTAAKGALSGGTMSFNGATVTGNAAMGEGGGIYTTHDAFVLRSGTMGGTEAGDKNYARVFEYRVLHIGGVRLHFEGTDDPQDVYGAPLVLGAASPSTQALIISSADVGDAEIISKDINFNSSKKNKIGLRRLARIPKIGSTTQNIAAMQYATHPTNDYSALNRLAEAFGGMVWYGGGATSLDSVNAIILPTSYSEYGTHGVTLTLNRANPAVSYVQAKANSYKIYSESAYQRINLGSYTYMRSSALPAMPHFDGYVLQEQGWYLDEACTKPVTHVPLGQSGDLRLYGKYTLGNVDITYSNVPAGMNNPLNPPGFITGTSVTIFPLQDLITHTFDSWKVTYTMAGETMGKTVTGKTVTIPAGAIKPVVAVANWSPLTYTVAYENVRTGFTNPNGVALSYGVNNLLEPLRGRVSGAAFAGWTDAAGNALTHLLQEEYTSEVIKLYATYEENAYPVYWDGGKFPEALTPAIRSQLPSYYKEGGISALNAPTLANHAGYYFNGWYTSPTVGAGASLETFKTYLAYKTDDVVFYAQWVYDDSWTSNIMIKDKREVNQELLLDFEETIDKEDPMYQINQQEVLDIIIKTFTGGAMASVAGVATPAAESDFTRLLLRGDAYAALKSGDNEVKITADGHVYVMTFNREEAIANGKLPSAEEEMQRRKKEIGALVPATKLAINMSSKVIKSGKKVKLEVWPGASNMFAGSITWKSSNTKVATVSSTGQVKALKKGTATITATSEYGPKIKCKIYVNSSKVPVSKVAVVKPKRTTLKQGTSVTLAAKVSPTNANSKKVVWQSSNPSVATVNSKGKVTAKAEGKVKITARSLEGGKTASCTITVKPKVTRVALNQVVATAKSKQKLQLKAMVSPSNAFDKSVTWKSSNTKVATVSSKGLVKCLKKGTVKITVTTKDGKKKATCVITIT